MNLFLFALNHELPDHEIPSGTNPAVFEAFTPRIDPQPGGLHPPTPRAT
jgi:hypothetical protein